MESTIRYDFSFPPKSSSQTTSSSVYGMNGNGSSGGRHHSHHFSSSQMPKSGSTSLLSCAHQVQVHSVAGGVGAGSSGGRHRGTSVAQNGYCYGCAGRNDSSACPSSGRHQHVGCNGQYNSNASGRHRTPYSGQYQQQQSYPSTSQSTFSSANITAPQSTSAIGAPGTPKDGNCSFSNLRNFISYFHVLC